MNTKIDIEKDKNNIAFDITEKKYVVEGKEYFPWEKQAIEARDPMDISIDDHLFFLYDYDSYEDYKKFQTFGNKEKIHMQSVQKTSIKGLSKYIYDNTSIVKFGLCHGTRRGNEQKWFKEYISLSQMEMIDVLGTEISDTATQFTNTIEWDFHNVKDEWVDNTCFIYSNSLDHSYDPAMCLKQWMSCLKKDGLCMLEWSPNSTYASKIDPFAASFVNYIKLVLKCGFYVKNLLWLDEIVVVPKKKIEFDLGQRNVDVEILSSTKLYIVVTNDENQSVVQLIDNNFQLNAKTWQYYDHLSSTWKMGEGGHHSEERNRLLNEHFLQNINEYTERSALMRI